MNETAAAKLIEDLRNYEEGVYPNLDPDYASAFSERVRELGVQELLTYLFRSLADSTLKVTLHRLRFAWRDVSFDTWMRILEDLANDRRFVYQFLRFASSTLAIDIRRLPTSQPVVQGELGSSSFRDGVPAPRSREERALLDDDFDYESMWRRLESEGAPMLTLPAGW